MKYDNAYLYSRDIDWFCVRDGIRIHVASAGGLIPESVNVPNQLKATQKSVARLHTLFREEQIVFNDQFLLQRFGEDERSMEAYCWSFYMMASKGFISLDRTNVPERDEQIYHFVCAARPILESLMIENKDLLDDLHLTRNWDMYGQNIPIESIMNQAEPFVLVDNEVI